MKSGGYFVISLDFELMWGMFDKVTIDSYGANIRGVHTAVPELLHLFRQRRIHATWATVGMLMSENEDELSQVLPPKEHQPVYPDQSLSSYEYFSRTVSRDPEQAPYHFAPRLVTQILATPNQELASHTFTHYYCLDGGENSEAIFAADCTAMQVAAEKFHKPLHSIIFPRNQTTPEALATCKAAGLRSYRGTETHFLYQARKEAAQSNLLIRGLRLLDHYLNLSGHHTYPLSKAAPDELQNFPASRFLRPFMPRLKVLEPLRLRRIKNAMTHAAKHGEVFHLWWHPHNFGINRKENLKNLVTILEHYQTLNDEYGMQSRNMQELATLADAMPDAGATVDAPQTELA